MYLLDTDHIGVLQRKTGVEYPRLVSSLDAVDPADIYVPIVSFHEQVTGWNAYLNRARTIQSTVRAYQMFEHILADFAELNVASFDMAAANRFDTLRAAKVRIGTMDLRIAAIALVNGWTVVTRNLVDFARVPNLLLEDWTA